MRGALAIATTAGLLLAGAAASAQTPEQPSPAALAAETVKSCFACHGDGGVSRIPTRPTIAGQKSDYVARQLTAFRRAAVESARDDDGDADDGAAIAANPAAKAAGRMDPIMSHMAETLGEAQIPYVAAAVAALACDGGAPKAAPANPPAMPPAAQHCTSCHGEDGIGNLPHVPNIAGQQRAYLRRQLLLIRETAWGAQPRENENWRNHPIMERQAARISIEDVDALAHYYASLDCRGAGSAKP